MDYLALLKSEHEQGFAYGREGVAWLIAEVERLRFFNEGIGEEIDELRDEVERLRRIEDALLATESLPPGREKVSAYITLAETLRANPRPGEG